MSDRGFNQDFMHLDVDPETQDAQYEDATYLGTGPDDEEEVRDLGFIVDDHDDRRATLTDGWQRLDDLDTNEPLETNRGGSIPHAVALQEQSVSPERFATDYNVQNLQGETQEEDFVETSMLSSDPDMNDGLEDDTSETLKGIHGEAVTTDIAGQVTGVIPGLGTSLPMDLGRGGFDIRDNPLVQPEGVPTSGPDPGDAPLTRRSLDDLAADAEREALADLAADEARRAGGRS